MAAMAFVASAQAPKEFDVAAIRLNTDGGERFKRCFFRRWVSGTFNWRPQNG
jgi:hypothetical protein